MTGSTETKKLRPAERLAGMTLSNGWFVKERVSVPPSATGGHFSVGYLVSHPEKPDAFLKAIDYSTAMHSRDPARDLYHLTQAFLFERDLCLACAKNSFDHVVVAIDHGACTVNDDSPLGTVQYIIFELATCDIRKHLDDIDKLDLAFALRALHNVAVGLRQLHGASVAHQDLKPSNVLRFDDEKVKVADLGRASSRSGSSPFDGLRIAGDRGYAPPELLYGFVPSEWTERRLGCDLYLFGSLVLFVFTRCTMTGELMSRIQPEYHHSVWNGDFAEVLPFLQHAFAQVLADARPYLPLEMADEIITLIKRLCNPDPLVRGDGQSKLGRQSLERFISQLDVMATKASNLTKRAK